MSVPRSTSSSLRFDVGTAEGVAASRRADRAGEEMSVAAACWIAERAHQGQVDANAELSIIHAGRVAAGVPLFARAVGCLHDAVERSGVDESVLVASGASSEERIALRLLSGGERECSDEAFVGRARVIARLPGASGGSRVRSSALICWITSRSARRAGVWSPPYGAALVVLMLVSASWQDTGRGSGRERDRLPRFRMLAVARWECDGG